MTMYTEDEDDVDVPDWAADINIGDTIEWESVDTTGQSEVIAWSTRVPFEGLPVIPAPHDTVDGPAYISRCEIEKKNFVGVVDE